jgi:hypothetical protein
MTPRLLEPIADRNVVPFEQRPCRDLLVVPDL